MTDTSTTSEKGPQPILRARNVGKSFGGVHALRDVSIDVYAGEVHAIVGENGAGKSTFGKILGGAIPADSGSFELDGRTVTICNPIDAQQLGITIIFQELDLFPNLTVAENIAIRNLAYSDRLLVNRKRMAEFCLPMLKRVGLDVDPGTMLGDLHLGHQQLVAIARALSMNARVIVFDESTSSLSDEFVENLFQVIDLLRSEGIACIFISHKMEELFRISDRVTVLRDGEYVGSRPASELPQDELIGMMVGRKVSEQTRAESHAAGEVLFECTGLRTRRLHDISFTLHRGEVMGLAGLIGAGRGELGKALFGLTRIVGGQMSLESRPYLPRSPRHAIELGVGLVPRDRKTEGLMMQMSVRDNTTLASLSDLNALGLIRQREESTVVERVGTQTRLRASGAHAEVSSLSGGNQQKVLLGRWLLVEPKVYFFDDPTRGVDIGAKHDIYDLIEQQAARGKGVLFVSSELPELLRCCDRILVLNQGKQVALLQSDATSAEEILRYATSQASQAVAG